ncbi:MAG: flagellar motor switch protein FliN [Microbacteriaceae bacterium]|jgi:flagellar motor switch protein FliN/FliY|nr:flagellar motor switch protein FliN [Microbacteriaceae bacterium]
MIENAYVAAAEMLRHAPLSTGELVVTERPAGSPAPATAGAAVTASYVGSPSADLALAVADPETILAGSGGQVGLGIADILHPSLVAAAEKLGSGVLGASAVADATELFSDPSALTFAVSDAAGAEIAWFSIRASSTYNAGTASLADVAGKLGRISNVEMALTVEIGRTRMSVRDVLSVEPGAVIELDRSAGSPADVLLNGRLIARGEIVVVDQDYAVRITQILDMAEELV